MGSADMLKTLARLTCAAAVAQEDVVAEALLPTDAQHGLIEARNTLQRSLAAAYADLVERPFRQVARAQSSAISSPCAQTGGRDPSRLSVLARLVTGVPSAGLRPLVGLCAAAASSLQACRTHVLVPLTARRASSTRSTRHRCRPARMRTSHSFAALWCADGAQSAEAAKRALVQDPQHGCQEQREPAVQQDGIPQLLLLRRREAGWEDVRARP